MIEAECNIFTLSPIRVQQIVDFLNVYNEPVLGYAPPTSVTTLHLHLWSCSLDYRYSRAQTVDLDNRWCIV